MSAAPRAFICWPPCDAVRTRNRLDLKEHQDSIYICVVGTFSRTPSPSQFSKKAESSSRLQMIGASQFMKVGAEEEYFSFWSFS